MVKTKKFKKKIKYLICLSKKAIVLASLKCPWEDFFSCLYGNIDDKKKLLLTPQFVKHILKYFPDEDEVNKKFRFDSKTYNF